MNQPNTLRFTILAHFAHNSPGVSLLASVSIAVWLTHSPFNSHYICIQNDYRNYTMRSGAYNMQMRMCAQTAHKPSDGRGSIKRFVATQRVWSHRRHRRRRANSMSHLAHIFVTNYLLISCCCCCSCWCDGAIVHTVMMTTFRRTKCSEYRRSFHMRSVIPPSVRSCWLHDDDDAFVMFITKSCPSAGVRAVRERHTLGECKLIQFPSYMPPPPPLAPNRHTLKLSVRTRLQLHACAAQLSWDAWVDYSRWRCVADNSSKRC